MSRMLLLVVALSLTAAGAQEPSPAVALPANLPKDAILYRVLISGHQAGSRASWRASDGRLHVFFAFNDRGRGPRLETVSTLGADEVPSAIDVTGNDYLKDLVDEHFQCDRSGSARWSSKSERGERAGAGGKFYVSVDGEWSEALARALLAHGGRLPLLPAGEASIEKVRELSVEANGTKQDIALYAISGLDLSPEYLWLDASHALFASGSTWSMVVREGFNSVVPQLLKIQQEIVDARAGELAQRLTQKPSGDVIFTHANVFDSTNGKVLREQRVLIRGDRIVAVEPMSDKTPDEGARVIDATGKMLLPGLWDMHVHVQGNDPLLYIACGVTTVRDMANDIDELLARRKRIENGEEIGPRIITAGFIDGPGPYQGPSKILAATEAEARAYVDRYAQLGYPQIKIYSSLEPKLVPPIIDEAHKLGLRVSGHIPAFMTAEECIRLGLDEMQHMNFVFLNFMPDVGETRTPARFTEPARRAAEIDPKSERVQAFLRLLKERDVVIDSTLSIFEGMFTDRAGTMSASFASVADRFPVQMQRGFRHGGLPVPDGMDERYRQAFAQMKRMLKEMYDQGVTLVAGTDSLAGFALHRELEIYVEAGLPASYVLRLATLGAASVMRKNRALGSITPGKLADVILVDGDPTADISAIRKVRLVVKDGRLYDPAEIAPALGMKPGP